MRSIARRCPTSFSLSIRDDKLKFVEHVFRPDEGWGIPGGFMSKGEQPEAALRRELREEIGIEVQDVELLLARTLTKSRQIEIYFRAKALGSPEPCSFEIKSARWFAVDDLPIELSKDQRRLIRRALIASENSYQ